MPNIQDISIKMDCKKGGQTKDRTHQVSTLKKAIEWWEAATTEDLPLTIDQFEGTGGRLLIKVFDCNMMLRNSKG